MALEYKQLDITQLRTDGGTQPRKAIDNVLVSEYAEAMKSGAEFPPVVAFWDGVDYWLVDGFHRLHAARGAEMKSISVERHEGTRRDAVIYSVGANAAHGQRRSNDDKRKAVLTLLEDEEWSGWSDREIARRCAVSHQTVSNLRASLSNFDSEKERTYTDKHGNTTTMDTKSIGKRKPQEHTTKSGITRKPLEERISEIEALAEGGFNRDQIAKELGIGKERVIRIAQENHITLPDEAFKKSHKINATRVIEETVNGLEGYALGLGSLVGSVEGIHKDDANRWLVSISESVKQFNVLKRKLKEVIDNE